MSNQNINNNVNIPESNNTNTNLNNNSSTNNIFKFNPNIVNNENTNINTSSNQEDGNINYFTFLKELFNICNSSEDETQINQRILYYLESLDKFILSQCSKRIDSYNEWIYLTLIKNQIENNKIPK